MTALARAAHGASSGTTILKSAVAGTSSDYTEVTLLGLTATHRVDARMSNKAKQALPWLRRAGLRPSRCLATAERGVAFYFLGTSTRFASLEFSEYGVAALTSDRASQSPRAWDVAFEPAAIAAAARSIREHLDV